MDGWMRNPGFSFSVLSIRVYESVCLSLPRMSLGMKSLPDQKVGVSRSYRVDGVIEDGDREVISRLIA